MESWKIGVREGGMMNIPAMTRNILDVKDVLDRHGVKFCLYMGTLLGAVREENFIEWDDDADLLTFAEDKPKMPEVIKELKAKGFYIPTEGVPASDTFIIREGEKIDLWWYSKVNGRYQYDPDRCPGWPSYAPKYLEPLAEIQFLKTTFKCPQFKEEFLNLHYSNWLIPDKNRGWRF